MGLNLEAKISLDAASFQRGMANVTNSVMNTVKAYALGAIGVTALEKAFFKTLETVKDLINESKRMGVTVEQLQVMKKAASGAGVEISLLAGSMEKLNVARSKALGGGAAGAKAMASFSAVGVTPAMLQTLPAQDIIFGAIRDKIKSVNPQDVAGPLRDILGRGFGPLVPLITKDMAALQVKMEKFGMIISTETAYQLREFDIALNSVKNIMVSGIAPYMVKFGEALIRVTGIIAGIGAFLGGGSRDINKRDVIAGMITPLAALKNLKKFDVNEGIKAFKDSQAPYIEAVKDIRNAAVQKSKTPAVAFASGTVDESGNKKTTAGELKSDSLVSAGNFLGAIRGEIPQYEKQKIDLLQRIATAVERPNASSSGDDWEN